MSATLDGEAVATLLDGAPLLRSEGRQYPVDVHYGPAYQVRDPIVPPVVKTVHRALQETEGSVLVFLPGQSEVNRVGRELGARLAGTDMNR